MKGRKAGPQGSGGSHGAGGHRRRPQWAFPQQAIHTVLLSEGGEKGIPGQGGQGVAPGTWGLHEEYPAPQLGSHSLRPGA